MHVVPCRKDFFSAFFSSVSAFTSSSHCTRSKPSNARDCRRFSLRLHCATHLSLADMQTLCKRSGFWTPALGQSLYNAVCFCTSCQMTGTPHAIRKISTSNLSRTFNSHIQVNLFYVEELEPRPILHIRDTSTGFSACFVQASRDMDLTGCNIQLHWIYLSGPASECSGDPEFDNATYMQYLKHHGITYKSRPA